MNVGERFLAASAGFEGRLRAVEADQWTWPTPCVDWDVRQLVNHMTRANLNFKDLAGGGTAKDFIGMRDVDALGGDPVGAYARSVRDCAEAFGRPGALELTVDYPLGRISGRQALAVRATDTAIHTWDLARAIGADENLDAGLVAWIDENLEDIYAGLPEMPTATETTHRFFAAPAGTLPDGASQQDRLLHRTGRNPGADTPGP
jgi:uncharacterized protein (TIGR03086 family)